MSGVTFRIVCVVLMVAGLRATADGDVLIDWNRVATEVIAADTPYQNPGMASRTLAMVNLAMYDAVNQIAPVHQPFYAHAAAPVGVSPEAAAAKAAHQVLSSIYPGQSALLDPALASSLNLIADGPSKSDGVAYGQSVGAAVVANRQGDGFDAVVQYVPTGEPGHWEPDPLNPGQEAWGPGWGEMVPFVIASSSQYMPAPMPAMTDAQYTQAFNEVKELGAKVSAVRTPEQTNIGLFWAYDTGGKGTPMNLYNQVLRNVAEDQGNNLHANARLFAMASVAIADAGIVAWDSKFEYDLWRPISGIRRADEDGNPDTEADPTWQPLGAPGGSVPDFTPRFPTYVSGHATFGGALFQALTEYYGTDEATFSVTSAELTGPEATRTFTRFSDAMAENGRSRVYLGIHWSFDDLVGRSVGADVARAIAASHFQPVPEPATLAWMSLGGLLLARCRPDPR